MGEQCAPRRPLYAKVYERDIKAVATMRSGTDAAVYLALAIFRGSGRRESRPKELGWNAVSCGRPKLCEITGLSADQVKESTARLRAGGHIETATGTRAGRNRAATYVLVAGPSVAPPGPGVEAGLDQDGAWYAKVYERDIKVVATMRSAAAAAVYCVLVRGRAGARPGATAGGCVEVATRATDIARATGLSADQVKRAARVLVAHGCIERAPGTHAHCGAPAAYLVPGPQPWTDGGAGR